MLPLVAINSSVALSPPCVPYYSQKKQQIAHTTTRPMLSILHGTEKGPWPLAGGFPFDHTPSGDGSSLVRF